MTDDIDDLLSVSSQSTPRDYSSASWAVIHRRARRRAIVRWVGVAGLMLVAGLVGWSLRPPIQSVIEFRTVPTPPAGESFVAQALTADQAEQQAELSDDPDTVARCYRQAGDLYLRQQQYGEAERCYRLHVRAAGSAAATADDSWLLTTVKLATPKGNRS